MAIDDLSTLNSSQHNLPENISAPIKGSYSPPDYYPVWPGEPAKPKMVISVMPQHMAA